MKSTIRLTLLFAGLLPVMTLAAEPAGLASATVPSAGDSLGRMVLGTVIVLLVLAAIAWLLKRVMPGQGLSQSGVIRQVGGVQLGPRERVVVLEVAGRWLVVGMGQQGQMTALGDVAAPVEMPEQAVPDRDETVVDSQASFAVRLQQAMQHTVQQTVKSFKSKP